MADHPPAASAISQWVSVQGTPQAAISHCFRWHIVQCRAINGHLIFLPSAPARKLYSKVTGFIPQTLTSIVISTSDYGIPTPAA